MKFGSYDVRLRKSFCNTKQSNNERYLLKFIFCPNILVSLLTTIKMSNICLVGSVLSKETMKSNMAYLVFDQINDYFVSLLTTF